MWAIRRSSNPISRMERSSVQEHCFIIIISNCLMSNRKHYVAAGRMEKAEKMVRDLEHDKMAENHAGRDLLLPLYASLGKIGDVEKLWKAWEHRLRMSYAVRMKQYQLLPQAYVNAKVPAYGFRERMKADNIFPNNAALAQLRAIDTFKKTEISELLD